TGVRPVLEKTAADPLTGSTLLELDVPADLAAVADPLALDRIVSNLLTNAATHGEPPVVLSAGVPDAHLRISVRDHGGGVSEPLSERLFDQFHRGEASTGAGLGLSIARAYARAHGGGLLHDRTSHSFELVLPNHPPQPPR